MKMISWGSAVRVIFLTLALISIGNWNVNVSEVLIIVACIAWSTTAYFEGKSAE